MQQRYEMDIVIGRVSGGAGRCRLRMIFLIQDLARHGFSLETRADGQASGRVGVWSSIYAWRHERGEERGRGGHGEREREG
jgi:hypothetical protein